MNKCPSVESGDAGKAESCKGCPNAKVCASAKPDEDIPTIRNNLKNVKFILAVLSGKGGVGKSTVSRNIASHMAKGGFNTLLLDFDLSGPSIPRLTKTSENFIFHPDLGFKPIEVENNLSTISIGHLETADDQSTVYNTGTKNYAIKKILKNCDFSRVEIMIIDTPPNITDEHLALVNYIKPDCSVILTTPQYISFDDAIRQINFCKKANISILGIVENMKGFTCSLCSHKNIVFRESKVEEYCSQNGLNYIGSIELKTEISRESDSGNTVNEDVFSDIAKMVANRLAKND